MKLTLQEFGGRRSTVAVDGAALEPALAAEMARLVDAAESADYFPPLNAGLSTDALAYEITIENNGRIVVLSQSDTTMSAAFAELCAWIKRHGASA